MERFWSHGCCSVKGLGYTSAVMMDECWMLRHPGAVELTTV